MLPRPTVRGWGLVAGGLVLVLLGALLGAVDLVRGGVVALVLVVGAEVGVAVTVPGRGRHRIEVRRSVDPNPVHVGEAAQVSVEVVAVGPAARVRLAGLRFAEQAATELSGGRALRARVNRGPGRVSLQYRIGATRRGRWSIGPLVVIHGDPFGVVRAPTTLGGTADVDVWPEVVALPPPSDVLVDEPDRVALGARTPSPDDAALRDYREGDDLRRVHWRSSARRGALLVRSDERAGMRPVSVLLDQPVRTTALEWSISLAASMAIAMLEGGHPVRLVGLDAASTGRVADGREMPEFVHARSGPQARATLLDRTIDLVGPRSDAEAEQRLLDGVRLLETAEGGGEMVLAVLGPLSGPARAALVHASSPVHSWAVVRADGHSPAEAAAAEHTVRALRRAGWRVCRATVGEDMQDCWRRLLGIAA